MFQTIISNGSGYSELLGNIGGLTVTETCNGYVGFLKNCENFYLFSQSPAPDLFSIELDLYPDPVIFDNVKVNFVDEQGWVYFTCFRTVTIP